MWMQEFEETIRELFKIPTLKTMFNIVEERLNFFLNFDVSAV